MAKKPSRLGKLFTRRAITITPDAPLTTPADVDRIWHETFENAIRCGNGDIVARTIADEVVKRIEQRDHVAY